jgi:hypothetical protein
MGMAATGMAATGTTLEACVEDEVQAATGFDRDGHGLIAVELDGQLVQVLATGVWCRRSGPERSGAMIQEWMVVAGLVAFILLLLPAVVAAFLRDVDAGSIRLVSWLHGSTAIYRGPGKSKEVPLFTTGTTISSKVINVDLDSEPLLRQA